MSRIVFNDGPMAGQQHESARVRDRWYVANYENGAVVPTSVVVVEGVGSYVRTNRTRSGSIVYQWEAAGL